CLGSSKSLTVNGGGVSTTSTNLVSSVSGNQLTLSWPTDHTGWTLQSETNLLGNWQNVSGSTVTNQMIITVSPAYQSVFYRLEYNP
ncbi:MAG TPA: hypothetical protein VK811_09055, partial [Candidatus Acidoferrum sp.]|nr:hypothetical protein [Candidatus Acidoferrum sp.]